MTKTLHLSRYLQTCSVFSCMTVGRLKVKSFCMHAGQTTTEGNSGSTEAMPSNHLEASTSIWALFKQAQNALCTQNERDAVKIFAKGKDINGS